MAGIIGSILHFMHDDFVGGGAQTALGRQASIVYSALQDAYGELTDGAWRPREWAVNDQAAGTAYAQIVTNAAANFGVADNFGIFGDIIAPFGDLMINWVAAYKAAAPSDTFNRTNFAPEIITAPVEAQYDDVGGQRFLIAPGKMSIPFLCVEAGDNVTTHTHNGALFGELRPIEFVKMTNNQDLVSYRRERIPAAAQSITTLDGSQRTYVTGNMTTQINATWRWSDDGTKAAILDRILNTRAKFADPLVIYIPAGIYYNGPFLDLVVPDNNPTVIMPAPGVYELPISGRCQP